MEESQAFSHGYSEDTLKNFKGYSCKTFYVGRDGRSR